MSKYKETAEGVSKMAETIKAGNSLYNRAESSRVFLSTGNTLLNLQLSNHADGGLLAGRYYLYVGDSSSGKTFSSMALFAEAIRNPIFAKHRLIFDDVEGGNLFDLEALFGSELISRIEAPALDKEGLPIFSATVESFYYNMDRIIKSGEPFIYVLDSMDALTSTAEQEKFQEQQEAFQSGKQVPGSYGDGKAKSNSAGLRKVLQSLANTNSLLIVINQTRDDIRFGARGGKTHSGGHALEFYATALIWASVKGQITKTVHGKLRKVGQEIQIEVRKNRIIGAIGKHTINFYPTYGFDDLSSCVNYLLEEGHWQKTGVRIDAPEFEQKAGMEKLVHFIEVNGKEAELQGIVENVWQTVREETSVDRKARYALGEQNDPAD